MAYDQRPFSRRTDRSYEGSSRLLGCKDDGPDIGLEDEFTGRRSLVAVNAQLA
jgi:hypothetical protein